MNSLEYILDFCKDFTPDPKYVYKLCMNRWFVVLEKTPKTKTNEARLNIYDPACAMFRASVLNVVAIIDIHSLDCTVNKAINELKCYKTDKKWSTAYEVGSIVEPDSYDPNINNICTSGIHYFKTPEPAYYYVKYIPTLIDNRKGYYVDPDSMWNHYTGPWKNWYSSGQLHYVRSFVDGKVTGTYTEWHPHRKEHGQEERKYREISYVENTIHGQFMGWHENGQIKYEREYVDGKMVSGKTWNESGEQILEPKKLRTNI